MVAFGLAFPAIPPAQAQVSKTAKVTTLHTFTGGADGGSPYASVIRDSQGNLYGATFAGGSANLGAVLKITKTGKETVLYSFAGKPDGEHPTADLLLDAAGNLYGTAYEGGANGFGAIFKISKSGKEKVLYSFGATPDGQYPGSGLIQDAVGNLYGVTGYGGKSGNGTVFRISKSGKETVLHNFNGQDGQYPFCRLFRDSNGNLYGTTSAGGTSTVGTVWELSKGHLTVLHNFEGGTDGANPYSGVVRDNKGNLYGTTYYGGEGCQGYDCGTVFKISSHGLEKVLHTFTLSDGHYPDFGTLLLDASGKLWGTTYAGGENDLGVVFRVSSGTGAETIVYTFTGGDDEGFPVSGLIQDDTGNFYGTTLGNPPDTYGTVFKLKP
jgi:uncharacterized repeat protein (TIGR03803 family)